MDYYLKSGSDQSKLGNDDSKPVSAKRETRDVQSTPPFLVVGLGRCGCHVSAELSEIISRTNEPLGADSPTGAEPWYRGMFGLGTQGAGDKPALRFEPIMLVGDIDETSFTDVEGLLQQGQVADDVRDKLLRLDYRPIGTGGVGHVPLFAEFLSRAMMAFPEETSRWSHARDFLTSFSLENSTHVPRLVFYIFSTGGGTGAGSAAEIMRAQSYARAVRKLDREMYFTGFGIMPHEIVGNDLMQANSGRMIVQYLADLNIRLDSPAAYDEALSCDGGTYVTLTTTDRDVREDVLPWNGLALVSNRMMSSATGQDAANQEDVESDANQYIAQQVFNMAAAQFPAAGFEKGSADGNATTTKKNFQAIRLDPNDLRTGLVGPYAIAFGACPATSEVGKAEMDEMFFRAVGPPQVSGKKGTVVGDLIQGLSVLPDEDYGGIHSSLVAERNSGSDSTEDRCGELATLAFFGRCPRIVYSLTAPQEGDVKAEFRERVEELIAWTFPNLTQSRAAVSWGTTTFFSLSIYIEMSVLLSPDVQRAIIAYLKLCWKERQTCYSSFQKEYLNFIHKGAPIDDAEVEEWLGKREQYGKNVQNFDHLCGDYDSRWERYVREHVKKDDAVVERLLAHKVEDVFVEVSEVASALRYLNYAYHVGRTELLPQNVAMPKFD